jgi:hypothetical protein
MNNLTKTYIVVISSKIFTKYLGKQGNNNSRNTRYLFSKLEDNPNNSENLKILQLWQMVP